jgi:hypothetical protein
MEPEGSLSHLQELSTCRYPEPDESTLHHPILSLQDPGTNNEAARYAVNCKLNEESCFPLRDRSGQFPNLPSFVSKSL